MGANYGSSKLVKCCNLERKNEVKFDSGNPPDIGRNQVNSDSASPGDSNRQQLQPDSSTFTPRPTEGGALFAQHMFTIYTAL